MRSATTVNTILILLTQYVLAECIDSICTLHSEAKLTPRHVVFSDCGLYGTNKNNIMEQFLEMERVKRKTVITDNVNQREG